MGAAWGLRVTLAACVLLGAAACSADDDGGGAGAHAGHVQSDTTTPAAEIRDELLAMAADDQTERTGGSPEGRDEDRAARLQEIIDEQGWPTIDRVGAEAASAAWLIAQHADHDVEFQEFALELMRRAAADGEADPTEVAYLEDRVAVNRGRPQTYGTQVECVDGAAVPRPLADEATVDQRRAEVGLGPLADYLAEFDCSTGAL